MSVLVFCVFTINALTSFGYTFLLEILVFFSLLPYSVLFMPSLAILKKMGNKHLVCVSEEKEGTSSAVIFMLSLN